MYRDRLLATGLAGLAGAIADMAIHWAGVLLRLGELHTVTGYYLAQIIFASTRVNNAQLILGELAHLLAGGTLGMAVLIMLRLSGRDYALAKGAALGAILWLNHVIIVPSFVAARISIIRSVSEVLIDLAALIAWGAVTAVILTRLLSRIPGAPRTA